MLCQKHYDDRFFLIRSKLKGNWKKSKDGKLIELKVDTQNRAKYDASGKPLDERREVADHVFLLTKYNTDTKQFDLTIDNEREEEILVQMDMSASKNLKMVGDPNMSRHFKTASRSKSAVTRLQRIDEEDDNDLDVQVTVDSAGKYDQFGKPLASYEERHEVAENVILVSRFDALTREYAFFLENHRDETLSFELDFSGSSNVKMTDGGELMTFLSAEAGGSSETLTLAKADDALDHDFALDVFVHSEKRLKIIKWESSSNSMYALESRVEISSSVWLHSKFTKPVAGSKQEFIFLIENQRDEPITVELQLNGSTNVGGPMTHSFTADAGGMSEQFQAGKVNEAAPHNLVMNFGFKYPSDAKAAPKPIALKHVSSGLAGAASVFEKGGFAPTPQNQKMQVAEECDVRYYGAQRFTTIKKNIAE